MITLRNLGAVGKAINDLPKQVRFASSKAINLTALAVQKNTVEKLLPSKFTLRSRGAPWWRRGTKFGFNIKFSNKASLVSTVGSQANWLDKQERGGTKTASGRRLAVVQGARPSPTAVLPARLKPKALLNRKGKRGGFTLGTRSGEGVFVREDATSLKLMYLLKPSAKIEGKLEFVATGKGVVEGMYERTFREELIKAIATAK